VITVRPCVAQAELMASQSGPYERMHDDKLSIADAQAPPTT
jgi:hypothetical protein